MKFSSAKREQFTLQKLISLVTGSAYCDLCCQVKL